MTTTTTTTTSPSTLELLELMPPSPACEPASEIKRCVSNELSYDDFYWRYMHRNWPVLLTDISTQWECRLNWTLPAAAQQQQQQRKKQSQQNHQNESTTDEGTNENTTDTNNTTTATTTTTTTTTTADTTAAINYDYLRQRVGDCRVPVADLSREYFNSHVKTEMCFHQFLDHWQRRCMQHANDALNSNIVENAITTTTTIKTAPTPCVGDDVVNDVRRNLYLKDWHLKAQMPDYEFYRVPKHFASDWLNEHLLASGQDDYRFVYMGPKDTWTPFHADVFGSYSWSTNIAGCKKWLMLPPGEELKLSDQRGALPFCIDEQMLQAKDVRYYTVLQAENEALFVPSGWHHQVWNLSDTISINHNWFNACNVQRIWTNLSANMQQVIAEIDDCRQMDNFEDHCQTMLRASFGMNYSDFLQLLETVAERRLSALVTQAQAKSSNGNHVGALFDIYVLNDYHVRYDLRCIRSVLAAMLDDEIVCNSRTFLYRRCMCLTERINDC